MLAYGRTLFMDSKGEAEVWSMDHYLADLGAERWHRDWIEPAPRSWPRRWHSATSSPMSPPPCSAAPTASMRWGLTGGGVCAPAATGCSTSTSSVAARWPTVPPRATTTANTRRTPPSAPMSRIATGANTKPSPAKSPASTASTRPSSTASAPISCCTGNRTAATLTKGPSPRSMTPPASAPRWRTACPTS